MALILKIAGYLGNLSVASQHNDSCFQGLLTPFRILEAETCLGFP